jgi:hypothetical protein
MDGNTEFFTGNELIEIRERIINWRYSDYCNWCKVRNKKPMNYILFLEIESKEIDKRKDEHDRYLY